MLRRLLPLSSLPLPAPAGAGDRQTRADDRDRRGNRSGNLQAREGSADDGGRGIPAAASPAGDPPLERNPSSFPSRFSKEIIASVGFSHSLDPQQNSRSGCLSFGMAHQCDAVFANRRQDELKAGAARQAANKVAPRQKSKGLRDISNPSKRRSTDHEIVAPLYFGNTVEEICHTNGSTLRAGGNYERREGPSAIADLRPIRAHL